MPPAFFRRPMTPQAKSQRLHRFNRASRSYEATQHSLPSLAAKHLAIMEASDRAVYDSLLCLTPKVLLLPPIFSVSPWPTRHNIVTPSELVLSRAKFLAPEMLVHNLNAFAPRVFSFLPVFPEMWPCYKPIVSWQDQRAWNFKFHSNSHKVHLFADYYDRGYLCSMRLASALSAGRLEAIASALSQGAINGITVLPNEQHRPHDVRQVIALRLSNIA